MVKILIDTDEDSITIDDKGNLAESLQAIQLLADATVMLLSNHQEGRFARGEIAV
ncbi:MAG: hypothetical protein ACXQS4_02040 [Methermicoccaceae archaeon]